jgi:Tol biopolymer transport system component
VALETLVVLLVPSPPASAIRGDTVLVSRMGGASGPVGDAASYVARISADGHIVAFASNADNLSLDDDDAVQNIFVRDLDAGTTTLVSRATGSSGAGADEGCNSPTLSGDGRFVAFESGATNLSPDDADAHLDIFVRDTLNQTTIFVSRATGANGAPGDGTSSVPAISSDGRFVVFVSTADDLSPDDIDAFVNVFVRDTVMNTTILVSRADGAAGPAATGDSSTAVISGDGRFVAFYSAADNLSPDDDNAFFNVFLRDTLLGTTTLISRGNGPSGPAVDGDSFIDSISADGRFVAFESNANSLSPDDDNASSHVFVRDTVTGSTTLASRADGVNGAAGNNGSDTAALSADGRFVTFESNATNLSPDDDNAVLDIYVRDLERGTTTLVSRATGAAGPVGDASSYTYGFAISADGRFVTFESDADNLSPDDTNLFEDVFRRDLLGVLPRCTDVTQTVVREAASIVSLTCSDDDGDTVTRTLVTDPTHGVAGAIDQAAGTVSYTPTPGYRGPDTFTFTATDSTGDSPVATVTLNVAGCVAAPTFASIDCRLDELVLATAAGVPDGKLGAKLASLLSRADSSIATAEGLGTSRKARKALGRAIKALSAFGKQLRKKSAKKLLDPATVASLRAAVEALRQDVAALRGS